MGKLVKFVDDDGLTREVDPGSMFMRLADGPGDSRAGEIWVLGLAHGARWRMTIASERLIRIASAVVPGLATAMQAIKAAAEKERADELSSSETRPHEAGPNGTGQVEL